MCRDHKSFYKQQLKVDYGIHRKRKQRDNVLPKQERRGFTNRIAPQTSDRTKQDRTWCRVLQQKHELKHPVAMDQQVHFIS
ncbi:hypothetical protein HanIR_Chr11g0506481 [Helianthus annuus]|nr:hypothetical protein HanIR_Chr11g0506481 [Helianthus annuus]